jgi:hypothetical protein
MGIRVKVEALPEAALFKKQYTKGEPFDIAESDWVADYFDPFNFLNQLFDPSITPAAPWGAKTRSHRIAGRSRPAHSLSLRLRDTVRPDQQDSRATSAPSPDVVSDLVTPPRISSHTRCLYRRQNGSTEGQQGCARAPEKMRTDLAQRRLSASMPEPTQEPGTHF